jgi:predicted nucleotidyltransferase
MFTAEHRDHVRARVLDLARTDPRVTAGALTGSTAVGAEDAWSDIDVAFEIADGSQTAACSPARPRSRHSLYSGRSPGLDPGLCRCRQGLRR